MSPVHHRSQGARRTRAAVLLSCALAALGCAHTPVPALTAASATSSAASGGSASAVPFVSPLSYEDFIRAELFEARGQHAQAIEAYRAAIAMSDGDPYLTARLAEALDRAGRPQEAEAQLERALSSQPRSEALLLAKARIARRAGDADRALSAYARAQEAASRPDTAFERIAYLRELGSQERATEALKALAQQHWSSVRDRLRIELELALVERSHRALVGCARDWLALGGGDPGLTRRAAGVLLDQGHAALAIELLHGVPPSESDAPVRLQALLALGRAAECEHLLSSLPPHWLGGPLAMGEAYLLSGRPEEALRVLRERSGAEDAATAARRAALIARSLAAAGRPQEASALLDRADTRSATCEALEASALFALARDAGCERQR